MQNIFHLRQHAVAGLVSAWSVTLAISVFIRDQADVLLQSVADHGPHSVTPVLADRPRCRDVAVCQRQPVTAVHSPAEMPARVTPCAGRRNDHESLIVVQDTFRSIRFIKPLRTRPGPIS